MNFKTCGRKVLWSNLRYSPGVYLERLRNITKNVKVNSPGRDSNREPPEYKSKLFMPEPTCAVNYGFLDFAVVTTEAEMQAVPLHAVSETARLFLPLGQNIFLSICVNTCYLLHLLK
jgi:hypothetical protein